MIRKKTYRSILSVFIFTIVIYACSCTNNKKLVILKIRFECFPATLVDSLNNILLSNSYADLGGKDGSSLFDIFSGSHVYVKNLKRNNDSCFYLHNVEPTTFEYIYLEGFVDNALFKAYKRKLDFSKTTGDTAEVTVCFEPNIKVISN